MTDIDYLRMLSNEKLAKLLEKNKICNCTKCITDWSETERKSKKEIN